MDGNRQKTTNEFMLRLEMIVLGQVKGVDCLSSSMAFHARKTFPAHARLAPPSSSSPSPSPLSQPRR
ncbi:hypothetical protein NL676_011013 [Syzygium grande]|nr:hypothetical protein NL676_011013 [Syzygium grande]